ncbi:hypothetical protein J0H58_22720 [bacterium]|nr:hypothetical protein [bacterium]
MSGRFGVALPDPLLRLWAAADGVTLDALNAHVPGPTELLAAFEKGNSWGDYLVEHGIVPVLDDHQSNYLVVVVRDPLAPRVVLLPHDDNTFWVRYRTLDGFAAALLQAFDAGESADRFFFETVGDYAPDAPRPSVDHEAARALLATAGANGEWNYAIQLLDATNLAEWERVLETDHFVRRDAVARMRGMSSPEVQALLSRDRRAFAAFAREVVKAARAAGLPVGEHADDVLNVGGKWMNLDTFFHRRNIPDALPRLVAWFEDIVAGRDPHDRPGHYMTD